MLRATEHHTFPACAPSPPAAPSERAALRGGRGRGTAAAMLEARDVKPGTCLRTPEGERTVASVDRRLASPEDVTYTVQLMGGSDMLVVGGVVTHAKPAFSHNSVHSSLSIVRKGAMKAVSKIQSSPL